MRRVPELDGLRGLAAVAVVLFHLEPRGLVYWGWAAVDLFFVLSGYLITAIILKHGSGRGFLGVFYLRRGLRIWPIYYLTILALIVLRQAPAAALPYYLTYTQMVPLYWGGTMPGWPAMGHTWTLAIEEQFYIIWPGLVLLAGRRGVVSLAPVVAAGSIAYRIAGGSPWLLASHCDGFALGGLLAALLQSGDCGRRAAWALGRGAAVSGLALLAAVAGRGHWPPMAWRGDGSWAEITAASLLSFSLVAAVTCRPLSPIFAPLRHRLPVYLGTISYGLYLYHHVIVNYSYFLTGRLGIRSTWLLWITELGLSLASAVVSWHLIEQPILRLKDRVAYRGSSAPPPQPLEVATEPGPASA